MLGLPESANVSVCIHIQILHLENTKEREMFLLSLIFAKIQSVWTMYLFTEDNAKRGNIEVLLTIHVNTFVHEYCLHPFQHIIIKKWSCFAEAETIGQFNLHFHIFKGEYSTF